MKRALHYDWDDVQQLIRNDVARRLNIELSTVRIRSDVSLVDSEVMEGAVMIAYGEDVHRALCKNDVNEFHIESVTSAGEDRSRGC